MVLRCQTPETDHDMHAKRVDKASKIYNIYTIGLKELLMMKSWFKTIYASHLTILMFTGHRRWETLKRLFGFIGFFPHRK